MISFQPLFTDLLIGKICILIICFGNNLTPDYKTHFVYVSNMTFETAFGNLRSMAHIRFGDR